MIFRKKTVDFPAWNYTVHIVVTRDIDAAASKLKLKPENSLPDDYKTSGGVTFHETNNGQSFLFVRPNADVEVAAHESWHCVRRMLEYAGASLDSETVAYHLGYLAGETYAFAHKRRK